MPLPRGVVRPTLEDIFVVAGRFMPLVSVCSLDGRSFAELFHVVVVAIIVVGL